MISSNLKPKTIAGQLILLIVGSIAISQAIMFVLFFWKTDERLDDYEDRYTVESVIVTYDILRNTPKENRNKLLDMASNQEVRFFMSEKAMGNQSISGDKISTEHFDELRYEMLHKLDDDPSLKDIWSFWFSDDFSSCYKRGDPVKCKYRIFSFSLPDNSWLNVEIEPSPSELLLLLPVAFSVLLTLIGISIVVSFAVRRISSPLEELSEAAEKFGRGEMSEQLSISGPEELSTTMNAFNVMQERLTRFVNDRTKMLAAISHDLRTPITSLRINSEFIKDKELQGKMVRTLEDMQVMVEACLAFAKEEVQEEETKLVDLVQTLEDIADESSHITFSTAIPSYDYLCHSVNLKRAFRNLLENAVKYGKKAHMSFEKSGEHLQITIQDQGGGIPEDQLENVFEPFVRLDEARNTESGSVGLGLSITRTIIHKHGGTITATNTNPGLKMVVLLPLV